MPRFDPSLYLVTAPVRAFSSLARWLRYIAEAVAGGVTLVQFRDKTLSRDEGAVVVAQLKALLRLRGIPLLINDSPELCRAWNAQGVHLGQGDGDPERARALLGPEAVIGLSLESLTDLERFLARQQDRFVDYVAASPVFATASKADTKSPFGLEGLRKIRESVRLPVVAIGGITPENVADVLRSGADGVAVISALALGVQPRQVARHFLRNIEEERQGGGWLLPCC